MSAGLVVCADDYAISAGTSAVIRGLLERGALNATSCLVETPIWPAEAQALRELCARHPGLGIGLHVNLTEPFAAAGANPKPLGWWLRRAFSAPSPEAVGRALEALRVQGTRFVKHFGRPPDFLDGHQHVQLYGPAAAALFQFVAETNFTGWIRQSGTSGGRFLAQRILMDPLSARLAARARARGIGVNPGFGGLRGFRRTEDLGRIWAADLAGMDAGGLLIVHPGAAGSPPGTESIDLCRTDEAALLRHGILRDLIARAGLSLVPDAARPGWGEAA